MISIHAEMKQSQTENIDKQNNLLRTRRTPRAKSHPKNGTTPTRAKKRFPAPWTREHKFWPSVARIDNVYGDRNLFCSCLPVEELENG